MAIKKIREEYSVVAAGGTIRLDVDNWVDVYVISSASAITLTSSLTVTTTGTPQEGMEILIYYAASITPNGNSITVLSNDLPVSLASSNVWIRNYFDGTKWQSTMMPNFSGPGSVDSTMLSDDAVITDKLVDENVTGNKLAPNAVSVTKRGGTLNTEIVTLPVSFETGEMSSNAIIIPFNCTINSVSYTVVKEIAASSNAIITMGINGVATNPATILIPPTTLINTTGKVILSSSANVIPVQKVSFTTSKVDAGGKLILTLILTRT
jgi:hypothetical protein